MTNITDHSSEQECREVRHLLGVYVIGAIEPHERSVVDKHLAWCQSCRDELAGLAALPAMLGKVPAADVERLNGLPEDIEPPPELLNSLLTKVAVRRRKRLWKGAVSIAAAVAVVAGSATAAVELAQPAVQAAHAEVVSGSNPATGVGAVVDYAQTPWGGTAMRVQVRGIPAGTTCQFFVNGTDGMGYAGEWTVQNSYGGQAWYPASSPSSLGSVHSFVIKAGGKVLLTVRAT